MRCRRCQYEYQLSYLRNKKRQLVVLAGGKCAICGYNKYVGALHFHHLDRTKKSFGIAECNHFGISRLKAEADKCILLCSNCHAEVEAGITDL